MERMIAAVIAALEAAGLSVTRALPAASMPRLRGPVTAVGLKMAEASPCGFYDYLGVETLEDGTWREVYGRRLEAQVYLDVYSPASLGGPACREAAESVCQVLLEGISGLSLGTVEMERCGYEAACDCFVAACSAAVSAYVYAVASEDGTEFTDFILKGELQ